MRDQADADVPCFHGGASWPAIGDAFDDLGQRRAVIAADVLDAWYPPSPAAVAALREHLDWALKTAPPVAAEGLVRTIGKVRGLPAASVLCGAGSSALIYLGFLRWLSPSSKVLLPTPAYGEYAHVCRVVGCEVEHFALAGDDHHCDLHGWVARLRDGAFDLAVLINPNNPTGTLLQREALLAALTQLPKHTRVWIDEAYLEHTGAAASVETFAASSSNVFVCRSLSKYWALSGVRAAYLAGPAAELACLRALVPPWAVSLPAQIAAVHALEDEAWYRARRIETRALQRALAKGLGGIFPGASIMGSPANWVLVRLPAHGPAAASLVAAAARRGVFVRDVASMGISDGRTFRVAVQAGPVQLELLARLRDASSGRSAGFMASG